MDTTKFEPMIEELRDRVDDLEVALAPLLRTNLADVTSKLPLLDKAKLSVLTTYAIESILFSVLKLNGVDAKEHAVFKELARVKQYFEKIKQAETSTTPVKRKLDGQVANRLIHNALNGNAKFDRERADRQAREKANAHKKFADLSEQQQQRELQQPAAKKQKLDKDAGPSSPSSSSSSSSSESEAGRAPLKVFESASNAADSSTAAPADKDRPAKKAKSPKKANDEGKSPKVAQDDDVETASARKHRKRKRERPHDGPRKEKSHKAPRDSKTVMKDLLARSGAAT